MGGIEPTSVFWDGEARGRALLLCTRVEVTTGGRRAALHLSFDFDSSIMVSKLTASSTVAGRWWINARADMPWYSHRSSSLAVSGIDPDKRYRISVVCAVVPPRGTREYLVEPFRGQDSPRFSFLDFVRN